MKKWLIGLACVGMMASAALGQIASLPTSHSGPWTNAFLPTGWVGTGLGADYSGTTGGYDSTGGGAARFDGAGDLLTISFDSAPGDVTYWARLNVGSGTWTTNVFSLQESVNGTDWSDVTVYNDANPIPTTAPTGPYTSTPSASARYLRFNYVQKGNGNVGVDGVTIAAGSGVTPTNVKFHASSAAVSEDQGTYQVTVYKTLAEGDVSGQIALSGTATEGGGADYTVDTTNFTLNGATTSAVITVTINDDDEEEIAETMVMDFANVVGAGTTAPATFTLTIGASDQTAYGISIVTNAPSDGTVTTTPAGEAIAGTPVTIGAVPASGYAVQSIAVNGEAVAVSNNVFTMPAEPVTVAVTFAAITAEGIVDFRFNAAPYLPVTVKDANLTVSDMALTAGTIETNVTTGTYFTDEPYIEETGGWGVSNQVGAKAFQFTITPAEGASVTIDAISFKAYATAAGPSAYGIDVGGLATYSVDAPSASLLVVSQAVAGVVGQTGAIVVSIQGWANGSRETAGTGVLRLDDVVVHGTVSTGPLEFSVSFNKLSGFTVEQGVADAVTATAAHGTAPYGYSWSSTLGSDYYEANAGVFTILDTAPVGDYSAQVVATDSSDPVQNVTNSLDFSVVAPPTKYAISIVTNAPANGTVATTPATEAVAGATVTVNATPAGGYAVESIAVNGGAVTVTGNTFVMPAEPVVVTVTFAEHVGSNLIISEVTDPADVSNAKFVEIYNAGGASIDLSAGQWYLSRQANGGNWASVALTGTVGAAQTHVVIYSASNFTAAYPAATYQQVSGNVLTGNGDDGYFLYSGGSNTVGTLEDAYGVLNEDGTGKPWEYEDARAARNAGVTAGNPTWTASEWTLTDPANVADMTPGVHPDGPVVFGVTFDKASGFTVEQGASDAITATAANGTAPYGYSWSSTLGGTHYSAIDNVFTILATAPIGDYSATVTATDDAAQTASNTVTFSVVAPPTKYAISIVTNAPANGTVTTTPATEAAAGATVTVNATPAGGYAVESIVVNGGAVTVTGNTFVMPAEPATVTVAFMEYTAPDVLITFETGTLPSAYAANTATLEDGKVWSTMRVVKSNSDNDKKIDTLSARLYPQTGTNAVLQQTEAYAEPISEISYWVASYGSDNMANVTLAVEVSSDGTNWETAETLTGADDITATLTEHVVATVPANAVYVRFVATAEAASNKRINLDNIGFNMGTASFGVSLNKSNGFEVQEGQSDSIIATAANGTTPYSYEWDSTLGATFYNASGDAFTILATAPTGSYSATVTATDAALATAQKTVTFSVVGLGPGPAVIIAGSRTGTVGVPMELTISVTNETAEEWFVDLKDPTGADAGWDYANFPPTFSMTPTMTGTYVLVVTAQTGSGNVTNTANLVIGAGDGGEHPSIPAITFVAGTGFNFPLPDGHTVSRMEAAGTATDANGEFIWSAFTDYTVDGSTVTINSAGAAARMIRVWFN